MGRWIGVDYGTRRIGLAVCDPGERIASPAATLDASGTAPNDAQRIIQWAQEYEPTGFVVGLPLNMDGSAGPQSKLSQAVAQQLERQGQLPVHLWDERLTSFQADEYLNVAGVHRSRRKRLRDALAAQVILQAFLDARRSGQPPVADV